MSLSPSLLIAAKRNPSLTPHHFLPTFDPRFLACSNHTFFFRSTTTGVLLRGALIAAIYERSVKLTGKARVEGLGNGKLINHISTDVSRIDFAAGFFHLVSTWGTGIRAGVVVGFGFETRRLTGADLSLVPLRVLD